MTNKMLTIKQIIFLIWKALIIGAVTFGVSNMRLHPSKMLSWI
jgi:hypothetical protein